MENPRGTTMNRTMIRFITRIHTALYRLTGGVVGGLISGTPNLLLTTRGRKSGKSFTTPLLFLPDGDTLILVASYGGSPQDPQWWQNLKVDPTAEVQVGSHRWPVTAEQASEELKARMWPVFCRYYSGYAQYQASTDRIIPLVVLRPNL
jgi:deazaflavin-dependent oxidoreductase (nitroreductase family)